MPWDTLHNYPVRIHVQGVRGKGIGCVVVVIIHTKIARSRLLL